jgi:predicted dithiol-disulfide oxidoreductase (DUF899 family)
MDMTALAKSAPQALQHIHFPNESPQYRRARNALLEQEMELRRQVERVAAQRRALPPGGAIPEDYVFEAAGAGGKAEAREVVGAVCAWQGYACDLQLHVRTGEGAAVSGLHALPRWSRRCARTSTSASTSPSSPSRRCRAFLSFAKERGWRWLQLLSTAGNAYDRDYFGDSTGLAPAVRRQQEFKDGEEWDMPILNVFRRGRDGIYHFWGCELLYVPPEPGQEYRHNDLLDPVWNMFDLAPEGRGDFQPKLDYTSGVGK